MIDITFLKALLCLIQITILIMYITAFRGSKGSWVCGLIVWLLMALVWSL